MRRLLPLWLAVAALAVACAGAAPALAHPGHDACASFQNQALAQHFFLTNGGPDQDPHNMDEDGDGIACESRPCPCNLSTTPPPPEDPTPVSDRDGDGAPDTADLCPDLAARTQSGCPAGVPPGSTDPAEQPTIRRGVVTGVLDGWTLRVRTAGRTRTVRLLGLARPGTAARPKCGSLQARSTLLWMTFTAPRDTDGDDLLDRKGGRGAPVELISDPTQPARDEHGRLLRYVHVDAFDLARAQLRRGWASVDLRPLAFGQLDEYKRLEAAARQRKRGAWGACARRR